MLGEVPFRHYYGTRRRHAALRDAGLGVLRAHRRPGHHRERSGRRIEAALAWMRRATATGTATASSNTPATPSKGLENQGWKDSHDSIFHADGQLAEGPIALCEVQGYVYAAKTAAELAAMLGHDAERAPRSTQAPTRCASASTRPSGATRSAPTRWRWTARSGHARCALQCGARAVHRHRRAGARRARRRRAAVGGRSSTAGAFARSPSAGALQPDVLPQRLGLAARQRADRAGPRPLRPEARAPSAFPGHVRRRRSTRTAAPAGAVLRLPAPAPARADAFRSPARRRPGRRRRPSRSWRHASASRSTTTATASASATRSLPAFLDGVTIFNLKLGTRGSTSASSATTTTSPSRCCAGPGTRRSRC